MTGTGYAFADADAARLLLRVRHTGPDLVGALRRTRAVTGRVLTAVRGEGVAGGDLFRPQLRLARDWRNVPPARRYTAAQSITAVLRAPDEASEVIAAAVSAGGRALSIDGLLYELGDPGPAQRQARAAAYADARARAEQLAAEAGERLGGLRSVREDADPCRYCLGDPDPPAWNPEGENPTYSNGYRLQVRIETTATWQLGTAGDLRPTVRTGGHAAAVAPADRATAVLEIRHKAATATASRARADGASRRLRASLLADGVRPRDIRAAASRDSEFLGARYPTTRHRSTRGFTVVLRDPATAAEIVARAVRAGGAQTHVVTFRVRQLRDESLLEAARASALLAAQKVAADYARLAGRRLGAGPDVRERHRYFRPYAGAMNMVVHGTAAGTAGSRTAATPADTQQVTHHAAAVWLLDPAATARPDRPPAR